MVSFNSPCNVITVGSAVVLPKSPSQVNVEISSKFTHRLAVIENFDNTNSPAYQNERKRVRMTVSPKSAGSGAIITSDKRNYLCLIAVTISFQPKTNLHPDYQIPLNPPGKATMGSRLLGARAAWLRVVVSPS